VQPQIPATAGKLSTPIGAKNAPIYAQEDNAFMMRTLMTEYRRLLLYEGENAGGDLVGALVWGEMAAVGDDFELRLREQLVHGLALGERRDVVFCAPDDKHGHFELREQLVCGVFAREHGGEGAMNDPGTLIGDTENVPSYEGGHLRGMGHEQEVELIEFGGGGGREEMDIPGGELEEAG